MLSAEQLKILASGKVDSPSTTEESIHVPVLNPVMTPIPTLAPTKLLYRGLEDARVVVVVSEEVPATLDFQGEFGELLQKMIAAMKLEAKSILRLGLNITPEREHSRGRDSELSLLRQFDRDAVIIFGPSAARELSPDLNLIPGQWLEAGMGSFGSVGSMPTLITYDFFSIVNENDLKKKTWSHLQGAMKRLGTLA